MTMNNEVIYKVNSPILNNTNCDYLCNSGKICNDSESIIDSYEDSELITDSDSSDLSLPINNIGRMMKLSIPGSAKISRESKMLMQQISKDFIGCISSQAGEICTSNKRRILNGEDIINALYSFGFGDYTSPLISYLNNWRGVKQSRNIKSYNNVYKSNSSSFMYNENYQFPTDNSQYQYFETNQSNKYYYMNNSQIDNQKIENNDYNKYFLQDKSSINNQEINYTVLPKCNNNATYNFPNLHKEKNFDFNPQKYSENTQEDSNTIYFNNKNSPNTLLISPTRSINYLNETSPITPKSNLPLNQCGKRKRVSQEEYNMVNNINYDTKNSTNTELIIENDTLQENQKPSISFSKYSNYNNNHHHHDLDNISNQYKQDDIFLNKIESSFDNYFSSDLYIQEESENDSEYNIYQNGLFIT